MWKCHHGRHPTTEPTRMEHRVTRIMSWQMTSRSTPGGVRCTQNSTTIVVVCRPQSKRDGTRSRPCRVFNAHVHFRSLHPPPRVGERSRTSDRRRKDPSSDLSKRVDPFSVSAPPAQDSRLGSCILRADSALRSHHLQSPFAKVEALALKLVKPESLVSQYAPTLGVTPQRKEHRADFGPRKCFVI
jgi:hypothetical protein